MGAAAVTIILSDAERAELERLARAQKTGQALARRARIVLASAEGRENKDICSLVGATANTVGKWRRRFASERLDGLYDEPRPGALVPGTGGVRKLRFGLRHRKTGKRGGARVIYYFHNPSIPLALLAIYAKGEKLDLIPTDVRIDRSCRPAITPLLEIPRLVSLARDDGFLQKQRNPSSRTGRRPGGISRRSVPPSRLDES